MNSWHFWRMWSNAALLKDINAGSAGYPMTDLLKITILWLLYNLVTVLLKGISDLIGYCIYITRPFVIWLLQHWHVCLLLGALCMYNPHACTLLYTHVHVITYTPAWGHMKLCMGTYETPCVWHACGVEFVADLYHMYVVLSNIF